MNNHPLGCDPGRIELFLSQQLSDQEQTAFEVHLDDCRQCRQQLERAAAGEDIWAGVRDSLRRQPWPSGGAGAGDSAIVGTTGDEAPLSHGAVLGLLAPADDERMLGRLGGYEVVGVIGSGGMGVVLKAFEAALHRYVAIKLLAPHLGSSGAARKRFSREAQAAAVVVHDNVIEIYGVADASGLPYLVMPYVRGPSLQRRLDDQGPLSLVEALRIGRQAAAGLAAAHAQGLVHRDVKPANILLADGVERVKLTDFGLARAADDASLTNTGMIAGTPQFMSPEQARGEPVDPRSDLFSLGSVLYAMCAGRPPFRAETSYGVLRRIIDEEPRPIREINPEIPEWLCQIIGKLMAKRPDDRFESASQVAKLLEGCLAHVQQPTAVPLPEQLRDAETSASVKPRRWLLRRLLAIAACALAFLLAGVVIVLELNKGTLTIESVADNVPVRIRQGDTLVEKLTVTRAGQNVRVAAGTYVVEIEGNPDEIAVENGAVTLHRGDEEIVRIVQREATAGTEHGGLVAAPLKKKAGTVEDAAGAVGGVAVPPQEAATDRHSLEDAAQQFNATTAEVRSELFDPPIPDLTVERLREGFRQSAALYRRQGKRQIADALEKVAERGRLPEEAIGGLIGSGAHAQDENGQTIYRQVVPALVLPDPSTASGSLLVVLRPLELMYRKEGPVSKDYGDLFDPEESSTGAPEEHHAGASYIARRVASRIEKLKERFPHLADYSPAEHLKKNTSHDIAPPGTRSNPELYSIMYDHGVLATKFPKNSSPKRSTEHTYDPQTGIQLIVHFFKGNSRGNDPTPPYRIGDLSVHVYVRGPAAEPIRREILRILEEVAAEVKEEGGEQPGDPSMPRLRVVGAGGRPVADNQVIRGTEGYSGAKLPAISETPSHRGIISLDRLAPGTHWLLVRGASPTVLRIELPASEEIIERTLPRRRSLIGKNLDAKLAVEVEDGVEFIDIEVHNRTTETIHLTELDLDLMTAITGPGADAHVLSPLWKNSAAGEIVPTTTIEPGQTATLRVNWPDWVKHGFWFSRDGEVIAEPTFPEFEAGKTWVRVAQFSALPVAVTHPDKIDPSGDSSAALSRLRYFSTGVGVWTIACSPDGKRIAIANGNPTLILQTNGRSRVKGAWQPSVETLDSETGKTAVSLQLTTNDEDALLAQTGRAPHFEVTSLAFCPEGKMLAVGTSIGQVKLYDVQTGVLTRSLDDERRRLADERTPEKLNALRRAMGSAASLAFSPDGSLLAVCGGSFGDVPLVQQSARRLGESATGPGRLKVWKVGAGTLEHDLLGHSHAEAVAFSPDGKLLASAGRWLNPFEAGTGVIVWDSQTGEKLRVIERQANGGTRDVAFSPDGKLVAIGSQQFDKDKPEDPGTGIVSLAHVASGVVQWQHAAPGWAKSVAFLPDGEHVAALCLGQSFRLLDTGTGTLKREFRAADFSRDGQWNDFAILSENNLLAIGGSDAEKHGFVEVWRLDGNKSDPGDEAAAAQSASGAVLRFSETKEVVLSMNSMKFMLDLDTDQTMDPPATMNHPEQAQMDVHPTQWQPYQTPTGLSGASLFLFGRSLHGFKVKPSDWDTSAAELRRALSRRRLRPLTSMPYEPQAPATYFFRTRSAAEGVLQLLALMENPKGIRVRYKTLVVDPVASKGRTKGSR